MSWGRGVNNNTAGTLRMPSIAQFAEQRLAKAERDLEGGSAFGSMTLTVAALPDATTSSFLSTSSFVYVLDDGGEEAAVAETTAAASQEETGTPVLASSSSPAAPILAAIQRDGRAYIYTHDHPHLLLRAVAIPAPAAASPDQQPAEASAAAAARAWSVPTGAIALSELQAINNHCCVNEPYEWHVFENWRTEIPQLANFTLELRHRFPAKVTSPVVLDYKQVVRYASTMLFGLVLTVNETFLLRVPLPTATTNNNQSDGGGADGDDDAAVTAVAAAAAAEGTAAAAGRNEEEAAAGYVELVARVVEVSPEASIGEEEEEEEEEGGGGEDDDDDKPKKDEVEEGKDKDGGAALTLADDYRGMVEARTAVFLRVDEAVCGASLFLPGAPVKPPGATPKDVVEITTSVDDEFFPVRARLLRPCLSLTSAVQAGKGVHASAQACASVNMDCCTFDRVLLFLEATATGRSFDILPEHLEGMTAAADVLKLQSLRDLCARKRGAFESRVRKDPISYEEVVRRNSQWCDRGSGDSEEKDDRASGGGGGDGEEGEGEPETILIMDGMVLDVSRWLPEHPGGSSIIPTQALNMDCTVFFEIYHVSRQSFLYLKEFYIGELKENDKLTKVPYGAGSPSAGFLEQLRQHTTWRVSSSGPAQHKSF